MENVNNMKRLHSPIFAGQLGMCGFVKFVIDSCYILCRSNFMFSISFRVVHVVILSEVLEFHNSFHVMSPVEAGPSHWRRVE